MQCSMTNRHPLRRIHARASMRKLGAITNLRSPVRRGSAAPKVLKSKTRASSRKWWFLTVTPRKRGSDLVEQRNKSGTREKAYTEQRRLGVPRDPPFCVLVHVCVWCMCGVGAYSAHVQRAELSQNRHISRPLENGCSVVVPRKAKSRNTSGELAAVCIRNNKALWWNRQRGLTAGAQGARLRPMTHAHQHTARVF